MNIYQRLANVRAAVRSVAMSDVSDNFAGFKRYIGHDNVTAALQQAYLDAGVHREVTVLEWSRADTMLTVLAQVSWINIDEPSERSVVQAIGESIIVTKRGPSLSDKQAGIAISYACKMAELKCLTLTGDDTPDAEQSSPGAVDNGPDEVPPELCDQLDAIDRAFAEGDAGAVAAANGQMRSIAGRLPHRTLDEFRRLVRAANVRLQGG